MARTKLLNGLTIKQDRFCREYVANEGNGGAAYRAAYDAENMSDAVVYNEASKLLDRREIAVRVEELQERACIMADQTVENLIAELQDAVKLAKSANNSAAMSTAIMAKAKLLGHVVDRQERKTEDVSPKDKPKLDELMVGLGHKRTDEELGPVEQRDPKAYSDPIPGLPDDRQPDVVRANRDSKLTH